MSHPPEPLPRTWTSCPLCRGKKSTEVYRAEQFAGQELGHLSTTLVMCDACDLVYNNPRPRAEDLDRFYASDLDASGQVFQMAHDGGATDSVRRAQLTFIAAHHGQPASLLDVGCGRGFFLHRAAQHFPAASLAGLEPSGQAAQAARAQGLKIHHGPLAGTVQHLAPSDVVTAFSVLEHVVHPREFLGLLKSLLAPGGHLFLDVPDSTRPTAGLVEFFGFEHQCHFTAATLAELLAREGLMLTGLAHDLRHRGHLLVAATADADAAAATPTADRQREKQDFLSGMAQYRSDRQLLAERFRERLQPHLAQWTANQSRLAVYGAGVHTEYLLGVLPELAPLVHCLLDSDPRKQQRAFHRWQVLGPESIPSLDLDAILISSQSFEDEIHASLRPHREAGLPVIRCYGDTD